MSARLSQRFIGASLAVPLSLAVFGCSDAPPSKRSAETDALPSAHASHGAEVSLEVIGGDGFQQVLRRNRGNVVLVDFWATWCGPCVEQFPHTVELHQRFADRGLTVVSVSLDDPEEERDNALGFLTRKEATFANFISEHGVGTSSNEAFDLDGPLPQVDVYDRQGNLHRRFGGNEGSVDTEQVDAAVEKLIAEG